MCAASALVHTLCLCTPESFKIQYLQFLAYTKTPQYKANLQHLLDQEKVCRRLPPYRQWSVQGLLVGTEVTCSCPLLQEKNTQLLGTAQQLFGHCQAQKEEIRRLFQQKLDEVIGAACPPQQSQGLKD